MSRTPAPPTARQLSAWTYLVRNPRRVVPIGLVMAAVAALQVAAITPTNAFERTADAYIQPLEHFTIVTPLRRNDFDETLLADLDANPHMEKRLKAKMLWIDTPSILGELSSPLLALDREGQAELMERMGVRLVRGKLPAKGTPGAALHAEILRARGMDVGSAFGRIVDPDDLTPGRFEAVGELDGGPRLGLIDLGYASIPDFVLARRPAFQVILAKPGGKAESDAYLHGVQDAEGRRALRVVDEAWARGIAHENLKNLPLVLGFITVAVAVIVAFVIVLITVITFQARTDEFALYLAVGIQRGRLLAKLTTETALIAFVGWVAGVGLGLGVVALYDLWLLQPKSIVVDVVDPLPIGLSAMAPVLAAAASAASLARRLRTMDPVAVLQRRGA